MAFRALLTCLLIAFASSASMPSLAQNFRWSSQGDAATLDPHSQNETFNNGINNMVYETLLTRDRQSFAKFLPGLAVSWTNTGPLTWVFKIRQGVKFHDGSPLTADDVVFSFNRARANRRSRSSCIRRNRVSRKRSTTTPLNSPLRCRIQSCSIQSTTS